MAKFNRIPAADASASVDKIARKVVQERVRAALHYWERIAKRDRPRVEDVHQIRVWSRRSLAALSLFAERLPTAPAAELKKILNKARKKAGMARDADILLASLDERGQVQLKNALGVVQEQRAAACHKLHRGYRKQVKSSHVQGLVKALGKRTLVDSPNGKPRAGQSFGVWFLEKIAESIADFRKQLQRSQISDRRIHSLRIAGKQLRYALEMGISTLPKESGKRLYQALEQLQEHLGAICDHQALAEHFGELAAEQQPKERSQILKEADWHVRKAQAGYAHFRNWWEQAAGRKKLIANLDAVRTLKPANAKRAAKNPPQRRKSQEK